MYNIDELKKNLNSAVGEDKAELYNRLSFAYWTADPDTGIKYAEKGLKLSRKINFVQGIIRAYNCFGVNYWAKGVYDVALDYYYKALKIAQNKKIDKAVAAAYNNIGLILDVKGELDKALEYYNKGLEIHLAEENKIKSAIYYSNIAVIYRKKNELDKALELHKKSLQLFEDEGVEYHINIANNYRYIGLIHFLKGEYEHVLEYYYIALKKAKELNSENEEAMIYKQMSDFYIEDNNLTEALKYAEKAYNLADRIKSKLILKETSETLSSIFKRMNDYKNAFNYHVIFKKTSDELLNEENMKKIAQLEFAYELEKKETENELVRIKNTELAQALEELKKSNASKDKFFSILAHDLRHPINSIIMFMDTLRENIEDMPRNVIITLVNDLNKMTKNTSELLENLLLWSRNQTKTMNFEPALNNIREISEKSIGVVRGSAVNKDIEIENNIQKELNVLCDRYMIDTIFRNLITNAVKFTERGGLIKLFGYINPISEKGVIAVEDSGVGISKENLKKIFDVSEKITTLGTDREKGTGLGLILCREFVEYHGGSFSVESKIGEGTKISFTLPLRS